MSESVAAERLEQVETLAIQVCKRSINPTFN
jgi:hypothetical protein